MSHEHRRRRLAWACAVLLICLLLPCAPAGGAEPLDLKTMFHESIPPSPFIGVVYRYADAMLQHGRDVHGPESTGLLLSALDRRTLSPLNTQPAAPQGVADGTRPGPRGGPLHGANPQMDQNVLRLLYFLVGLSGEDRYGRAADDALSWFLKSTPSESTGLLPWGEHLCWNVITDEVACGAERPVHELSGPWMLWEKCFQLAPQQSKRFALALCSSQLAGEQAGALYSRAPFDQSSSFLPPAEDCPRQAGFFIRTWAEAYAHTKEGTFVRAIDALLARCETARHRAAQPVESGRRSIRAGSPLSMAIDCHGAARKVPEPLRTRLALFAARHDRAFCSLRHDLSDKKGFAVSADPATAGSYTPLWRACHGEYTTAAVALMCVSRYENTGRIGYRELIVAAADAYLDSLPGDGTDAWPLTFGHAISLELAAFRITAQREYHARAFKLGEIAVERFFGDSPLPRASLHTDHYESTTGAGTLALALAELHLSTLHITAVRAPANRIDR